MQYRLRTLLIVVTLVAMCCAWPTHAWRMYRFHFREMQQHFWVFENQPSPEVEVEFAKIPGTDKLVRVEPPKEIDHLEAGFHHSLLADKYKQALFRPWIMLTKTKAEIAFRKAQSRRPNDGSPFP
jgi:hypothetical protein